MYCVCAVAHFSFVPIFSEPETVDELLDQLDRRSQPAHGTALAEEESDEIGGSNKRVWLL